MECRPVKMTCRWLYEITKAFHIINKDLPIIESCTSKISEELWKNYIKNHIDEIYKNDTCRSVLSYDIDYHDIIDGHKK